MEESNLIKKRNNKNKNKILTMILLIGIIVAVAGVSYAFFMYGKTGLYTHTINGGKMSVIYDETTGNNITIDNAYPLTDEEALTKGLEFEFTVTGYNESEKNVYYQIEMDHGSDVVGKNRFLDSDMKISLFENNKLVYENQVFSNLDNQSIHYGYINYGTNSESPVTNSYLLRIWINDNVFITSTPDYFNTEGKSVYSTEEFSNSYANFKINVIADLTYDDIGYLTYDANGGEFTPEKTSLTTGRVTVQKPVMYNKGFLGWSSDINATLPEYLAGDTYTGKEQVLYAVYGDTRNVMVGIWPQEIENIKHNIKNIVFATAPQSVIDEEYNKASIKADLTLNNQGSVKAIIMESYYDEDNLIQYYDMVIASDGVTYFSNGYGLFVGFSSLENIDFSNVDTSMVTDMSYMFSIEVAPNYVQPVSFDQEKSGGNTLDYNKVKKYNEQKIESCDNIYVPYNKLKNLDLSSFNTSQVTKMSYMFYVIEGFDCGEYTDLYLENIDLNHLDTSKVIDMSYMFANQKLITSLDISDFDTSNVVGIDNMFSGCTNITSLIIEKLELNNAISLSRMFYNCENLNNLVVKYHGGSKLMSIKEMFYQCKKLTNIDFGGLDTSEIQDMSKVFEYCENLENLMIDNFDTSNVANMSNMFYSCARLSNLDISHFNTSKVTNMSKMFMLCSSFKSIGQGNKYDLNISNLNTSQVVDMSSMFNSCSLTNIDISNFDTSNVIDMSSMFRNTKLSTLNINYLDTSMLQTMNSMFYGCSSLTKIDLSNLDTSRVEDISSMFSGCSSLKELDLSSFDDTNLIDASGVVKNCTNLERLDVSSIDFVKLGSYSLTAYSSYYNIFQNVGSNLGTGKNTLIYVGTLDDQNFVVTIPTSHRPSTWSISNVIIKNA